MHKSKQTDIIEIVIMKIFDMSERGIFMDITDVIVIGAGPAGLNAALYASRKELSVKIISTGYFLTCASILSARSKPEIDSNPR